MKKRNGFFENLNYIILIIVLFFIISWLYSIYSVYNFNDYIKTEYKPGITKFIRDRDVKYSDYSSYKIDSSDFNDVMFYKNVKVNKNTPYKVTCMVKTENIENEKVNSSGGAHISIADTVEKSISIVGTSDWQKIEIMFDSKNREELKLGFRLGGYDDNSRGTAWFSDFTIEEGFCLEDNNWKFGCFIFPTVDVEINGEREKLVATPNEIQDFIDCMERFKVSIKELSGYNMTATYNIIQINESLKTLSYDEENGYYISENDVDELIHDYVVEGDYDHIFVVARLDSKWNSKIESENDWLGLGSMTYYQIGFSNIKLLGNENNYIYKYDYRVNTFPEEVMVHEFIHALERTDIEYGNNIIALHDYDKYGYENQSKIGLRNWYKAYMMGEVDGNLGLTQDVYKYKSPHKSDFTYSMKLLDFDEPNNFVAELNILARKLMLLFEKKIDIKEINEIHESD